MTATLMAMLLAGAPVGKPKLLVLDLVGGEGLDPAAVASLSASTAAELERRGVFEVVTSRDLSTVLGIERQKQLMGCGEESCLTELSGAMGADFVLSGTVVKLGDAFTLNLQTVNARTAKGVGRSVRIARSLSELAGALPFAVAEAAALPAPETPSRAGPIVLIALGGAGVLAGGIVGFLGLSKEREVTTELSLADTRGGSLRPSEAYAQDASQVSTQKSAGLAAMIGGGVLLAAGILWYALSGSTPSAFALLAGPGGVALVARW